MNFIPAPSAFSLAAARLGWALAEVETLSLCGRNPAFLNAILYPGARILLLSADQSTPNTVSQLLIQQGFGQSVMHVFERLGGDHERHYHCQASDWNLDDVSPLNLIAIECRDRDPGFARSRSRLAGLPDSAFAHDGQITKQAVRAITLSALNPLPGQMLWDVGAGCGSISIEWLRSDRRCRAIAIEQHPTRLDLIRQNAHTLGTPNLQVVAGEAPNALKGLPQPQAIFIGGGLTAALLKACWFALPIQGTLVVNTITLASEQLVYQYQQKWGGTLTRIAIQRVAAIGTVEGWQSLAPITQWIVEKT